MAGERSVGELLDELFGFESVWPNVRRRFEQYDRGELVRRRAPASCWACLETSRAAEHAARESAVRAVDTYVRRVEGADFARARKQAGVVGPLQMEWRWCRLFCAWRTRLSQSRRNRRLRLSR